MSLTSVGRNINIDRLDSCDETVLGLSATCCTTLCIWIILIPMFDFIGLNWISTWEGSSLTASEFKSRAKETYASPELAFKVLDGDGDGSSNIDEWTSGSSTFRRPVQKQAAGRAFNVYDLNGDGGVSTNEFYKVVGSATSWVIGEQEFKDRAVNKYGRPRYAFMAIDKDRDQKISFGDFQDGGELLVPDVGAEDSQALFPQFDADASGFIEPAEFYMNLPDCVDRFMKKYVNATLAWTALDPDDNDEASEEDFVRVMAGTDPPVDPADARGCLEEIDSSGDDHVQKGEFMDVAGSGMSSSLWRIKSREKYGSMQAACEAMGVNDGITQDEFANALNSYDPPVGGSIASGLFTRLDSDESGTIDQSECFTSPEDFKNAEVAKYGSLPQAFKEMDSNHDGKVCLTELKIAGAQFSPRVSDAGSESIMSELDHDSDACLNTREAYTGVREFRAAAQRKGTNFQAVDADHNQNITQAELTTAAATFDPPIGAADAAAVFEAMDLDSSHGITADEFAGSVHEHGHVVTATQLNAYVGVHAIVQGRTEWHFGEPSTEGRPTDEQMMTDLTPIFMSAWGPIMNNATVEIQSTQATQDDGAVTDGSGQNRTMQFFWEADVADGGTLQKNLIANAAAYESQIRNAVVAANLPWMAGVTFTRWSRLTFAYYGSSALTLPQGISLEQYLGGRDGQHSDVGSPPYTLSS